jgi:hypothetical protein
VARNRKARPVAEGNARQLSLDGELAPGEVPVWMHRKDVSQLPYEDRLLKWFMSREEWNRKRK